MKHERLQGCRKYARWDQEGRASHGAVAENTKRNMELRALRGETTGLREPVVYFTGDLFCLRF